MLGFRQLPPEPLHLVLFERQFDLIAAWQAIEAAIRVRTASS